jgi:DUF4097 and DUF4098 domain-containing protein YvlB
MDASRSRLVMSVVAAVAGLGAVLAASGCDLGLPLNVREDGLREQTVVNEVKVLGDSGNVTVIGDSTVGVDVRRTVRYADNHQPGQTMSVSGDTLTVNTDCGNRCSASYEVHVAKGVRVTGTNDSGNITMSGVSDVDLRLDSGTIKVNGATGGVAVEANSGNVDLTDIAGTVTATVDSGNITGRNLRGTSLTFDAQSGNIDVTAPGSGSNVTARADSGNVTIRVPDNCCRVSTSVDSGHQEVRVTVNPSSQYLVDAKADSGNVTIRAV